MLVPASVSTVVIDGLWMPQVLVCNSSERPSTYIFKLTSSFHASSTSGAWDTRGGKLLARAGGFSGISSSASMKLLRYFLGLLREASVCKIKRLSHEFRRMTYILGTVSLQIMSKSCQTKARKTRKHLSQQNKETQFKKNVSSFNLIAMGCYRPGQNLMTDLCLVTDS